MIYLSIYDQIRQFIIAVFAVLYSHPVASCFGYAFINVEILRVCLYRAIQRSNYFQVETDRLERAGLSRSPAAVASVSS